jgi:predicted DNA-binding transcriptional regulator YafY
MAFMVTRYEPAARLHELRVMLDAAEGLTIYEIAQRFAVTPRTAYRYLQALQRAGEPLDETLAGKRKVWRLLPTARRQSVTLSTSQMVAFFLSRRVFDFLAGTGLKEDLDDVFRKLEATLKRRDVATARNLDRKLFDVNEARHLYEERGDDVNAILTALLREERLEVTHEGVGGGRKTFLLDPYTLLVYKKGLYLAGYSATHRAVRTFALDGFRDVTWRRGDKFEYPADYRPEALTEGAFGLIRGEPTRVRIAFDAKVAPYVRRRQWHRTQRFKAIPGGVEMTMDVLGTTELTSWVLGFGDKAEVKEPPALRAELSRQLEGAARFYREGASSKA